MGLRALRWWRRDRPRGLKTGQICIMWEAAYSCMDDTAWLDVDVTWFIGKAGGLRTIERQLPRLAELELLVRGAGGFRLPRFFAFDHQNGGPRLESSDNLTAKMADKMAVSPPHTPPIRKLINTREESLSDLDDEHKIQAVAKRFRIPAEMAEAAILTAEIRHFGVSSKVEPIRSLAFFNTAVDEVQTRWPLPKGYMDYLRRKAREAKECLGGAREIPTIHA